MVKQFSQLPWQMGLTRSPDYGLLLRSLHCVNVWNAAKAYQQQWNVGGQFTISPEQWNIIVRIRSHLYPRKKRDRRLEFIQEQVK